MHGGEITRLGGDFDSILVASLLVASLPGGEMTSYPLMGIRSSRHQGVSPPTNSPPRKSSRGELAVRTRVMCCTR